MENRVQKGAVQDVPAAARYLTFRLKRLGSPQLRLVLDALARKADGNAVMIGIGRSLCRVLGTDVPGLIPFPQMPDALVDVPITPAALWIWLRGENHAQLLLKANELIDLLRPSFVCTDQVMGFVYPVEGENRDLSGYVDGTENPKGDDILEVLHVDTETLGLAGSTFLAVQKWTHQMQDIDYLKREGKTDNLIGRRLSDNEEIDEAPKSAHVKRTAQESFAPEAFIVRRSLPWSDGFQSGLMFTSFMGDLNSFTQQWQRMVGAEDGTADGIFALSIPVSSAYFWIPPVKDGHVDLSYLLKSRPGL